MSSEPYDKIRPEALRDILRTRRAYSHEVVALAREVTESRAGGSSTDAERWQWFVANYHRLQFEMHGDGETARVARITMHDFDAHPLDLEALNAAVDAARSAT